MALAYNTRSGIPEHETQDFIKATADDDEIEDYSNHGRRLTNEVDDSSSALSPAADAAFRSLALEFKSLSSYFAKDSGDEITLNLKYKIGKGRKFDVKYLTADVENNQVIDVNFTAANSSTSTPLDGSLDELELTLDIVKVCYPWQQYLVSQYRDS